MKAVIFDFDHTITLTHTKGINLRELKEGHDDYEVLSDMYENPINHVNPSFLKFLHYCLGEGIPIYIATRGPVSNAIDIVNRAYQKWCTETGEVPHQQTPFNENNVVGAGTVINAKLQTVESIGQDCKEALIGELRKRIDQSIESEDILFIDDEFDNYDSARGIGISVYEPVVEEGNDSDFEEEGDEPDYNEKHKTAISNSRY
ncbi:MAG: hypothetical protein EP298_13465 [Gammaproteobacteria bacterium]|nr:MAG: hypothetical protein EP298_13465 [Gammaproteobacteria bacterium]UTW41713.1 hypothetical protein KFE69_09370 [bacterium SCSIO 12844]